MRIFGVIGLVLALAVVGLLVKRQAILPRAAMVPSAAASEANGTDRSQQLQSDVRQSLDAAMHTSRDVPAEP